MKIFQTLTLVRYFFLSLMKPKLHALLFLELSYGNSPLEIFCSKLWELCSMK